MKHSFPIQKTILGAALAVIAGAGAWQNQAQAGPTLDAADTRIVNRVDVLLRRFIKNPDGGPVSIKLVPTDRASEGYFSSVTISSKPVKLKKLYVSEAHLTSKNVKVQIAPLWGEDKVRTTKAQTQMRVVISEDDLTKTLSQGRATRDMKLKVKFVGDKMSVTGQLNYSLLNGPVAGTAKLRQSADHKVFLDILSLKLRGVEVPAFVKSQFSSRINPVIDYNDLPFNPPFKTLKVVGNKAYLST